MSSPAPAKPDARRQRSPLVTGLLCGLALATLPTYAMMSARAEHLWQLSIRGGCARMDVDGNRYWRDVVK